MKNNELATSIKKLRKESILSLAMVLIGILFLGATVVYSAIRVAPLKEEIAKLDAKKAELERSIPILAQCVRPAKNVLNEFDGWIYLGRESESGEWAPQSAKVALPKSPSSIEVNQSLKIKEKTPITENIDSELSDNTTNQTRIENQFLIKEETNIKIKEIKKIQSIGSGYFVWARTSVQPEFLLK